MNKYKLTISILLTLFLSISCNDYLKEEALDRFTEQSYFVSDAAAKGAVVGAYSIMTKPEFFKRAVHIVWEFPSDHFYRSNQYKSYDTGDIHPNENWVMHIWNSGYTMNGRINHAIKHIEKMDEENIKEENKLRYLGYLRFLRAFNYFNLVRTFGDIPLIKDIPTNEDELYYPRAPQIDIYDYIIEDLKQCIIDLPTQSEIPSNEYGFPSKSAAQGLLAKVYLTIEDWEEAVSQCETIISSQEFSLLKNYPDIFDVNNENNAEEIWSIQFTRDGTAAAWGSIGSDKVALFLPKNMDLNATGDPMWGTGLLQVEQGAYDKYTSGDYETDLRGKFLFATSYINQNGKEMKRYPLLKNGQGPAFLKYKDPQQIDERNSENNLYILRYADILLMKAEALNELGRTKEAYPYFNMVRGRSSDVMLTEDLTQDDFRDAVFEERGIELMGECQRWFDMIRMKRSDGTYYYDFIKQKAIDEGKYTHPTENVWALSYDPKMKLMPIPFDEINRNPKIGPADQNPGY